MWASASRSPDDEILISPPFPITEAPEMMGTAVFFHYINRMATVLLSDTPLPLRQSWARGWLKWVASRFFSKAVHRPKEAGASLLLLPEAELPSDLAWAEGASHIAGAFARLARVVDEAGKAEVPADVREQLGERLEVWDGTDPGLGKGWVADAIRGLDEGSKPAGRLAMLTAFAPYQIDDDVMKSFVKGFPGDRTLLVTLAWSSFSAARRIGGWLWAPQVLHNYTPDSGPGMG
jgi:hypothetical protein